MVNLKNSKIVVKSQGNNLKSPPGGPRRGALSFTLIKKFGFYL